MGGRAFPRLFCPRMRRELYLKAREQTFDALTGIFTHVTAPDEFPSKTDFGDVDFLVACPRDVECLAEFPWAQMIARIKHEFGTTHGRRGFFTEDCMYFAIPAPGREEEFFIQIDVKVCRDPELFSWTDFQLKFASIGKMIGSMVKPLGLTINPDGLWIRVEEMEDTDSAGSMVFLTKNAREVLKIIGLDRRMLDNAFLNNEELYHYLASSWVFNPAHFAERLKNTNYTEHLRERSKAWVFFVTKWIPTQSKYQLPSHLDNDVGHWYHIIRITMRESAFTMFPSTAQSYYEKRRTHLREVEEKRLRELIMRVLPTGDEGWTHDMPQPPIFRKPSELDIANVERPASNIDNALIPAQNTCILRGKTSEPGSSVSTISLMTTLVPSCDPFEVVLYLEGLPRPIPHDQEHASRPPPSNMSQEAKLLCLARWTLFRPDSGTLYLAREPREKKFEMCWINSGATDDTLVKWARDMWWVIWDRQHRVNWNGMWRHRMVKEDRIAKEAAERAATATALTGAKPEQEQRSGDCQESRDLVRIKSLDQDRSEVVAPADFSQHETETTEIAYDDRCSAEDYVHLGSNESACPRYPSARRRISRQCTILAEEELTDCKGSWGRGVEHTSKTSRSRSNEDGTSDCLDRPDEVRSISIRDLKRKADALHSGRAKSRQKVEEVNEKLGVLIFE